jgi:hypothetical protein
VFRCGVGHGRQAPHKQIVSGSGHAASCCVGLMSRAKQLISLYFPYAIRLRQVV